jgi:sialate O-acetylesterase
VIWYQGEANVSRPEQYRTLFPTLIQDWRGWWRSGDFPFLFVQIASFQGNFPTGNDQLPRLREAQQTALALANTGMAVTLDIGEAQNIHPLNKQDVGLRLALPALKLAYQRDLVFSGPVFQNFFREGKIIRVIFQHTGSGLMVGKKDGLAPVQEIKKGKLNEFEIAGPDGRWFPAEAKIEGHSVVVWHAQVPQPVAMRYAFSANPKQGNLYNREGLPAAPFRSDRPE